MNMLASEHMQEELKAEYEEAMRIKAAKKKAKKVAKKRRKADRKEGERLRKLEEQREAERAIERAKGRETLGRNIQLAVMIGVGLFIAKLVIAAL